MADEVETESAEKPKRRFPFRWHFHQLGGLNQVEIRTADDLRNLSQLDPKLWTALSCPASGLEFDARTLALIDTNHDKRIRIPEVVAAVEWFIDRVKDPEILFQGGDCLPLSIIDDASPAGKRLLATARAILLSLGKADADCLTQDDVSSAATHASEQTFNGDGVLPPLPALDQEVRSYISDAMAVIGAVDDASGATGINLEISNAFLSTLRNWTAWRQTVDSASTPVGKDTPEAWDLLSDLSDKIDDYFLRCSLVSYAPKTKNSLNLSESTPVPVDGGILDAHVLETMPLAHIEADKPLNLTSGLNPAYKERMERLAKLLEPLLPSPGQMTHEDWKSIRSRFGAFDKALTLKPSPVPATVTIPPNSTPDKLGEPRIREILASDVDKRFAELAARDAGVPAAASDITEVERLVLYHKHLYRLLINFASFDEFYSMRGKAMFQGGTLYIDGRTCRLCMPAEKIDEHSSLASASQLFLLYCVCERGRKPGTTEPAEKMNIVAAVTAGDADLLRPNRNGVYVDPRGRDWDATVVKVVSSPISLWEALWSPYKKFGSMIAEQISKYANQKHTDLMMTAGQKLEQLTTVPEVATRSNQRFDLGRNVGIFAAVGIALGAIGTAAGSIARALFAMHWWQFPFLLIGIFLIISGPSLLLAYLKLRQRSLGPLLEASGWAINGQVAINRRVSQRLTSLAELPENSRCTYKDPLASLRHWRLGVTLGLLGSAALIIYGLRSCDFKAVEQFLDDIAQFETVPPAGAPPEQPAIPAAAVPAAETVVAIQATQDTAQPADDAPAPPAGAPDSSAEPPASSQESAPMDEELAPDTPPAPEPQPEPATE